MSEKKVAILQSCYIPWKGYFDMLNLVDEFVLFDDTQFTKRDWRNRNKIKTPQGTKWLTIPVNTKGKYTQQICDTTVSDPDWAKRHWDLIRQNYAKAPYFKEYSDEFEGLYLGCEEDHLSKINYRFLSALCGMLGIDTPLSWSMDYEAKDGKNERLISSCQQLNATEYVSGPAAQGYIDEEEFARAGIGVHWMDYSNYPEYAQASPPFVHEVSILDLIFNEGPNAMKYMKSF